jgi:hypothetical protein
LFVQAVTACGFRFLRQPSRPKPADATGEKAKALLAEELAAPVFDAKKRSYTAIE